MWKRRVVFWGVITLVIGDFLRRPVIELVNHWSWDLYFDAMHGPPIHVLKQQYDLTSLWSYAPFILAMLSALLIGVFVVSIATIFAVIMIVVVLPWITDIVFKLYQHTWLKFYHWAYPPKPLVKPALKLNEKSTNIIGPNIKKANLLSQIKLLNVKDFNIVYDSPSYINIGMTLNQEQNNHGNIRSRSSGESG